MGRGVLRGCAGALLLCACGEGAASMSQPATEGGEGGGRGSGAFAPPGEAVWPAGPADYDYDDGGTAWDGGAPIHLERFTWTQGAQTLRGQVGQRFTVDCVWNEREYSVWGSGPYTDDSPVCPAGVHAGLITRRRGGQLTFELRRARPWFPGSVQNGVTALEWEAWPASYVFVDP